MPTTWIEPDEVVSHNGVTVYHTYKEGEYQSEYWYTLVPADDDYEGEAAFDIRDLEASGDSDEDILRAAIDAGEIGEVCEDNEGTTRSLHVWTQPQSSGVEQCVHCGVVKADFVRDSIAAAQEAAKAQAESQDKPDRTVVDVQKALVAAVEEADVAFVVLNMCDDLTPQARSALGRAWAAVQAAQLALNPNGVQAEAIKSTGSAYTLRGLLEEYLQRRNDQRCDEKWAEFDQKVKEVLL